MQSIGNRIRAARKAEKLTQQELAKLAGVSQTTVSDLERGRNERSRDIVAIAKALRRRPEWLMNGAAPEMAGELVPIQTGLNVTYNIRERGRVPLISFVQAGDLNHIEDRFHPGEAEEWIAAWHSAPGPRGFALRVEGDSMTNPVGAPSFPEGTVIIVDPDRAPKPGDYVVAKDVQTQRATFKRLTSDGARWFLRPLNPTYPMIEIDDPGLRVIGVVIEWSIGGRL